MPFIWKVQLHDESGDSGTNFPCRYFATERAAKAFIKRQTANPQFTLNDVEKQWVEYTRQYIAHLLNYNDSDAISGAGGKDRE